MRTQIIATAVTDVVGVFSGAIFKEALFPPYPSSVPIPASEPITSPETTPASEPIPAPEPIPSTEPILASERIPASKPNPTSEQIPASKPISDSEKNLSRNPGLSRRNGIRAVLGISTKELSCRRPEFMDDSWPAEFQSHL
jgi:hypothetical protein